MYSLEDDDIQAKDLPKEQSDVDHDRSDGSCQLEVHGQGETETLVFHPQDVVSNDDANVCGYSNHS